MSQLKNQLPTKILPAKTWEHYDVWDKVSDILGALPNYFESDIVMRGLNVTDIFAVGNLLSVVIESKIVDILNKLRDLWDPNNYYSNYSFIRQAQTFPDVLLANIQDRRDIIFGIELKAWYVFSKEKEPSFRFTITPKACATPDLLVVVPWLLSDVISGSPKLLFPYTELSKYVAEYRNYYWIKSRQKSNRSENIVVPPSQLQHPYPESKVEASDKARDDKGGNFGRIARTRLLDDYLNQIRSVDYLGIQINHWIKFFRVMAETKTTTEIDRKLDRILIDIKHDIETTQQVPEYKEMLKDIVDRLQQFQRKLP